MVSIKIYKAPVLRLFIAELNPALKLNWLTNIIASNRVFIFEVLMKQWLGL
jgi:hypothetical protein